MIKIPYPNQQILDNYFDEIKEKLLKKIRYIKSQKNISIDKKKFRVTDKIKKILELLEDESNLKKLIQCKPIDIVNQIKYVYKKFPKSHCKKESLNRIFYRIFVEAGYNEIERV